MPPESRHGKTIRSVLANHELNAQLNSKPDYLELINAINERADVFADMLEDAPHADLIYFSMFVNHVLYALQYFFYHFNLPIALLGSSKSDILKSLDDIFKNSVQKATLKSKLIEYATTKLLFRAQWRQLCLAFM